MGDVRLRVNEKETTEATRNIKKKLVRIKCSFAYFAIYYYTLAERLKVTIFFLMVTDFFPLAAADFP